MKQVMGFFLSVGIIFGLAMGTSANAAEKTNGKVDKLVTAQSEVVKFVNDSISQTADQLNTPVRENHAESGWSMNRMFIRVQGIMGIGVPIFTSFQIVPEAEFCIQKVRK